MSGARTWSRPASPNPAVLQGLWSAHAVRAFSEPRPGWRGFTMSPAFTPCLERSHREFDPFHPHGPDQDLARVDPPLRRRPRARTPRAGPSTSRCGRPRLTTQGPGLGTGDPGPVPPVQAAVLAPGHRRARPDGRRQPAVASSGCAGPARARLRARASELVPKGFWRYSAPPSRAMDVLESSSL